MNTQTLTEITEIVVKKTVAEQILELPTNTVVIIRREDTSITQPYVAEVLLRTGESGWMSLGRSHMESLGGDRHGQYFRNERVREYLTRLAGSDRTYSYTVVN